jgi:penicillin-binding protein 1A
MLEEGYITKENYEISKNDPIKVELKKDKQDFTSAAPQFTEYVRQLLESKAEKFGFDLYRDGLKVYTTLDTRFQKHAVDAVKDQFKTFQPTFNHYWNWNNNKGILYDNIERYIKQSDDFKKAKTDSERKSIYQKLSSSKSFIDSVKTITSTIQVGFTVIDPKTGEIKAMVGSNPVNTFKYGLNHVTQIKRQPGSSFKPFVYSVAIMNGYNPSYGISNDPINVNIGGKVWSPKGGGTGGIIPMRYGLAKSINVIAVRTAMELAPIDKVIALAHNMGIKSELPNYLSLALGVGEVSPLEMVNAYGTLANEGIWVEPIAITKIEDKNGNLIQEILPETREVMSEDVAYVMSDMMQDVVDIGTATSVRNFFNRPCAGKTGTTQDYTDAWFIGFTPQFVAGVWLGFDDARVKFGGAYGQGGAAAAPIWGRFMKYLYEDKTFDFPVAEFLMPDGVDEMSVCTITGLLSNGSCPSEREVVIKKFMPRKCNIQHSYSPGPVENPDSAPETPQGGVGQGIFFKQ